MRLKDQPWLTTDQPHWYETFVRDDRCRLSGTGKISYDLNKRSLKCSSGWKLNLVVCRRLTHADGLKAQSGHDEQLRLGTAWQAYSLPREDRRPLVNSLSCSEGCKSWVWCRMAALESLKRPVETWAYWRCQDHGMTAWDWAELCELWMAEQESQGYQRWSWVRTKCQTLTYSAAGVCFCSDLIVILPWFFPWNKKACNWIWIL